jgi:lysophospholipase L1-like esterase
MRFYPKALASIPLLTLALGAAECEKPNPPMTPLSTVAGFAAKAEKGAPLTVVFFGGSLTWGANASDPPTTSFRALTARWLRDKYPRASFVFHDASIGGTGSQLGLFRLGRDVLSRKPDLVFLDFTVNDNIYGRDEPPLAAYERILRELRASGAAVVPMLMCGYPEMTKERDFIPPRYPAHMALAEAHGLVAADTIATARAALARGEVTPAQLYPFGKDRIHPDDPGYVLFFEAARAAYEQAAAAAAAPRPIPEKTTHPDLYSRHERKLLVDTALPAGWKRTKTYRTSMWFDGLSSRWMGDVACAAKPEDGAEVAPLETLFRGSFVALFGERNPLTPPFRVWIDGKPVPQPGSKAGDPCLWSIDNARFASPAAGAGNLFAWTVLADRLADGEHTLKIAPDFTGAHAQAELRIESICSAGREPAE